MACGRLREGVGAWPGFSFVGAKLRYALWSLVFDSLSRLRWEGESTAPYGEEGELSMLVAGLYVAKRGPALRYGSSETVSRSTIYAVGT